MLWSSYWSDVFTQYEGPKSCKIYSGVFDHHGLFARYVLRFHLECCEEFPNSVWPWCCNMAMLARCTMLHCQCFSLYFKPVALTVNVAFRTDFQLFWGCNEGFALDCQDDVGRWHMSIASNLISLWLCNQREVPAGSFLSTFRFVICASFQPKCGTQSTTKWLSAALDTVHTHQNRSFENSLKCRMPRALPGNGLNRSLTAVDAVDGANLSFGHRNLHLHGTCCDWIMIKNKNSWKYETDSAR